MGDEAAIPVLRRKAGGGRATPRAPSMTPEKALRAAAARAGDAALSVPVSLRGLTMATDAPEVLVDGLPDPALYVLLDGPDGQTALAVACPQVVAAVIEAQTLGHVLPGEAATRRPTGTDAAMLADFLDRVLASFAATAGACPDLPPLAGYRHGRVLADARAGAMALADLPHRRITAELDFGLGAKTGTLVLAYPAERPSGSSRGSEQALWRATLHRAVMGTEARLEAVLCHLQRPLADLAALSVGDMVPLGHAALTGVSLRGPDGRKVVTGKLGRSGPMRAVRVQLAAGHVVPALQPAGTAGGTAAQDGRATEAEA